jgi:HEAT repeat protein
MTSRASLTSLIFRPLCFTMLIACLLNDHATAAGDPAKTQKLIAVLQSDAGLFDKARACQQLGETGAKEAVPALTALLADEQLSAYARSGLEGIPDPSATEALRTATSTLKGNQLIGAVNSLGVLRDAKAVGLLRKLAGDPASGAVKESLLALGRISTDESIQTIRQILARGPEQFRPEAAAACLLAAEKQLADGQTDKAMTLYDAVRGAKVPLSYRVGATRGAILARRTDRIPFCIAQLRSEERAIRNAALLTIREISSAALASALNAELAKAAPELQLLLLTALVDCHNPQSIQAIKAKTASDDLEIRKAALNVLGKIGGSAAAGVLLQVMVDSRNSEELSIAASGLGRMEAIDGLVLKALPAAKEADVRVRLIRLTEVRGMTGAAGELLKQATAPEVKVSQAAFGALASLATPKDLPALIALVKECKDNAVRDAAENAVVRTCTRTDQTAAGGEGVLAELKRVVNPTVKNSWIRILTALGYAKALPAIKEAMADANETVSANAIEQLGRWPDPAPIEDLLAVIEKGSSPAHRKLALAAVIQLATVAADERQRPEAMIVGWFQRADKAAQTVESKRRILSGFGRLKHPDSFRLLLPYLDNPELQTEAAQAVVQIAPALVKQGNPDLLKAALAKIVATIQNPNIRNQAAKIVQSIPK